MHVPSKASFCRHFPSMTPPATLRSLPSLILALLVLFLSLGGIAAPQDHRPPLSKDEVLDLLNSSQSSKQIITTIERYGIAFEPTAAVLEEFRTAGAGPAVLAAMRKAWRPRVSKPLTESEIRLLLAASTPSENVLRLVSERGVDFQPTAAYLQEIGSEGASSSLVRALRAIQPRPFSKAELLELLGDQKDQSWLAQKVELRAIDFDPDKQALQALRDAGAGTPLLNAVSSARRAKPFQGLLAPSQPLKEGGTATLVCEASDKDVPVFADPGDLGVVPVRLQCGTQVTFLGKVTSPPGFYKIQYGDGKQGFVSSSSMETPIATPGGNVTAPLAIFKPDAGYTPSARHQRIEGTATFRIVIDAQGNVAAVQETSTPLGAGLDQSAMDTLKSWRFKPATRDGIPIPVQVEVQIAFRLARHSS